MQSKKGLYMLIALISTVLIFFFVLFFAHENTLENGILFTVSFQYKNARDIKYNFYNQSGKIEKVENENSFLLEKTEYSTSKLLRKILKNLKESKTPFEEEGITIYNAQNKRYYLLPFKKEEAEELTKLILDGYIQSEYQRVTQKQLATFIYLYQDTEKLAWTKNGNTANIIHTYQCQTADCRFIYTKNEEDETVMWDENYYLYNYKNKNKQRLNIEENIKKIEYLKRDNQIMGIEVQNAKEQYAYYDLKENRFLTNFEQNRFKVINERLLLKQKKTKQDEKINIQLTIWNRYENENLWTKEIESKEETEFVISEIKKEEKIFYIIEKTDKETKKYQVVNEKGISLLKEEWYSNIEIQDNGIYVTENLKSKLYDYSGNLIEES